MRFSFVHKLASYLMASAAFAASALSGELPPVLVAAVALLVPLTWLWEPPRVQLERYETLWNLATAACFVYVLIDFLRPEGSLLSSGVDLLAFLLVNKLANRRTSKDYLQLYVISFLLLVAGTTLNTDLSYAFCFFAYVVFATWALTLLHLRREMEENYLLKHSGDEQSEKVEVERILASRRIVGGSFLAGTSAVSVGVFLGALVIFFLFPRIGMGFFFARQRHGQTLSGFSERVDLGMHGAIKNNPQVVMRIEFPQGGEDRALGLHMRGVAFDAYELGGQWMHTRGQREQLPSDGGVVRAPGARGDRRGLVQDIYLDPLNSNVLFGASRPVTFEMAPSTLPGHPRMGLYGSEEDEVYTSVERPAGFKYRVASALTPATVHELAAIPDAPPPPQLDLDRYLQLPKDLSPRIAKLAADITDGARGPYAKAEAVRSYLSGRYRYTTDLPRVEGGDPLADFLFRTRAGHCEYFATAMAVLLREVGVPTREVNGFYGGEWNQFGKYLAIRQMDAHAWVEVWFPKHGWITFDPTPPGGARAAASRGGLYDKLRKIEDSIELAWYKHMVEYSLDQQADLAQHARRFARRFASGRRVTGATHRTSQIWAILAAGAVVAFVVLRREWRARRPHRSATVRAQKPALTLYQKVLRRCARAGAVRPAAQTPLEFARALAARSFPGADVVGEVTAFYYRTRFGGRLPDPLQLAELERKLDRIGNSTYTR